MQPIVDRLEADYGAQVALRRVNVSDAQGAAVFNQFGLPGHPSIVILGDTGAEIYRAFGIVEEAELRSVLATVVSSG
jgi:thioredoxin-like negative regulator of GroEL